MLERCFENPFTLRRLRGGPAGLLLDGFEEALFAQGYSPDTRGAYLCAADHLGAWASRRAAGIADLNEALLARFVRHLPGCRCRARGRARRHCCHKHVPFRVHTFLRYLREAGVVATSAPEARRSPLVTEYRAWMRDQRGLAVTTISHSLPVVEALLGTVGEVDPLRCACGGTMRVIAFILDPVVIRKILQHRPRPEPRAHAPPPG